MQIAWGVDGVLADFDHSFTALLNEMFNLKIPTHQKCLSWNWFEFIDELTEDMQKQAWEEIYTRRPFFWLNMTPLISLTETPRINRLSRDHNMVFITDRAPKGVHEFIQSQTRRWLRETNLLDHGNNVFLSRGKKGMTGRTLGVHVAIDDSGPAVSDYLRHDIPAALLRRPHNEGYVELIRNSPGGHVVESVDEFLHLLTRWHVRQEEIDEYPIGLGALMH